MKRKNYTKETITKQIDILILIRKQNQNVNVLTNELLIYHLGSFDKKKIYIYICDK